MMRFETNKKPKKKDSAKSFSNFGFSTILLTFVMMCVVTFGVLALITSNSDLKLSKKVAEKSSGYYEAEETAYACLTQLDAVLAETYADFEGSSTDYVSDGSADQTYLAAVEAAVTQAGLGTYSDGSVIFSIPITDTQALCVTAAVNLPGDCDKGYYTITTWESQHVQSSDIMDDGTLNLMGSN